MPAVVSPWAVGEPPQTEPADPPSRRGRGSRRTWAVVIVVVCALLAVALWRANDSGPAPLTRADVNAAVKRGVEASQQQQRATPPDAATAYRRISPSLVTVTTEHAGAGAGKAASTEVSLGAGVVINAQGAVLTALHVVKGGGHIRVRFADGTRASASVATSEAGSDIAVLAPDRLPGVVVPAVMGAAPPVGSDVFAVGNPLGLEDSLSAGVVSATDRTVSSQQGATTPHDVILHHLIQFDAAVNPGNSGGPLLNRDGQVVGIVTGLANPTKQAYFVGIGFAVPITTAGGVAGGPQQ